MRTDEAALTALDAKVLAPDRDAVRNIALFERGGAGRKSAVGRYGADRNLIAQSGENPRGHGADELRRVRRHHSGISILLVTLAGTETSFNRAKVPSTAAKFLSMTD